MMRSALAGLAISATLAQHVQAEFVIEDDVYFYGQSEPVYPTREFSESAKILRTLHVD